MSRAEFEEWCKQERGMLCNDETQAWMLSAWLAGRESMRDEAAEIAGKYANTYKETKRAHENLSSLPFRPSHFGLEMQRVHDSQSIEAKIIGIDL